MSETRVACPPTLDLESGRELFRSLRDDGLSKGDVVLLDLSTTQQMDSLGGAWLMEIAGLARERECSLRWEGQGGDVAEFMALIGPGLEQREEAKLKRAGPFEQLGADTLKTMGEAGEMFRLCVDAIYWTFIAMFDGRGFRWSLMVDEVYEMGVRAIRINIMMNFLLGLIVAMLSAAQLEQFGASILVADLVVIAFFRELGAIMTAVVVSARTGAAVTAEIATMKVQDEIDALRGMGLNVAQFLVAPKLLALVIAMPCLVAIGMLAGIVGGTFWSVLVMGIDAQAWLREVQSAADLDDVFQGMFKAFIFSIVIVIIGCHNGLRVSGGSRGVGLMTTRAVVWDTVAIICIDMVFAAFFYYF